MSTVGIAERSQAIVSEVERAIVGKTETIQKAVVTLLCNGHLLLEDIPGVGKTTLAKAIARSIGGEFRRIQFTPDLLPADVTGSSIFNQKSSEFEFRAGPSSATSCLPTRLTVRRRRLKVRCWKRWKSTKLQAMAKLVPCPSRSL